MKGRRDPPPVIVTLIADTSKFDEAMRRLQQSLQQSARVIGERIVEGMRPFVERLDFLGWLSRSGEKPCSADHEFLVGRCPTCKAST